MPIDHISKDLINEFKELEKNPLFTFSLGSKELFHSNIISYIFQIDEGKFGLKFLENLNFIKDVKSHKLQIKREFRNWDLFIHILKEGKVIKDIIIENKVKSIPDVIQLDKYSEDYKNNKYIGQDYSFVLLTITEPLFDLSASSSKLKEKWDLITYQKLADTMELTMDQINISEGDYISNKQLIKSYCILIRSLCKIISIIKLSGQYNFYNAKPPSYIRMANDIRIQDLIIKNLTSYFQGKIENKLQSILGVDLLNDKFPNSEVGDCRMSNSYNNKKGTLDFRCVLDQNKQGTLIIGIQLEGRQLRYFTRLQGISSDKDKLIDQHIVFANYCLEYGFWFNHLPEIDVITSIKEESKGLGKGRNIQGFCSYYNGMFIYKYDLLPENLLVEEMIEIFVICALECNSRISVIRKNIESKLPFNQN
jgi:hypothetical protein